MRQERGLLKTLKKNRKSFGRVTGYQKVCAVVGMPRVLLGAGRPAERVNIVSLIALESSIHSQSRRAITAMYSRKDQGGMDRDPGGATEDADRQPLN